MALQCEARRAQHIATFGQSIISIGKKFAELLFAHGAFYLIATQKHWRKPTEHVAQSDKNRSRNGAEEEVKQE